MTINIIRYRRKTEGGPACPVEMIDGHLDINGSTKICDTAENALRAPPAGTGMYKRTDGAILLGEYLIPGCLKHPREAFERVY